MDSTGLTARHPNFPEGRRITGPEKMQRDNARLLRMLGDLETEIEDLREALSEALARLRTREEASSASP